MNALSKLLTKVAKRVLTNNPTNDEMLSTADRVVNWRNAEYISDEQVDEIANVIPETVENVDEQESTPESADDTESAETSTDGENTPSDGSE